MAAATTFIDTPTRTGTYVYLALAAATIIFAGTLVARDSNGRAVPASDTAGLRVVGRACQTVDNSAGSAGDLSINVEPGQYLYANSATNALTIASIGKLAVVEDDNTVASTSTNKVSAGRVIDVVTEGVWIDTRYAFYGAKTLVTATSSQNATTAASDLATAIALANALKTNYNALQVDVAAILTAANG